MSKEFTKWYCHCCQSVVIHYCGTKNVIGNIPQTKDKPCILQKEKIREKK